MYVLFNFATNANGNEIFRLNNVTICKDENALESKELCGITFWSLCVLISYTKETCIKLSLP